MDDIEQISQRGHAHAVEVIIGRLESSHGADCGQLGRGWAERPRGDLHDACGAVCGELQSEASDTAGQEAVAKAAWVVAKVGHI